MNSNFNKIAEAPRNRYKFSKIWKRSIKEADADTRRKTESLPSTDNDQLMIEEPLFWNKIKSLTNHIRNINKRIYIPNSYIIIDETILIFRKRTIHTTKLKNKPIKKGYKNWLLAEHNYA
jgi:hypothetical protein